MSILRATIYVDADSCPVKEEIILIAKEHPVDVIFVTSYAHNIKEERIYQSIVVDSEREAVDLYIVNHVHEEDIVVTQDHALAGILLPQMVEVISPRGYIFSEEKIMELLYMRYINQKQRRAGNKTKGPKKFTDQDREMFSANLQKILSKKAGI